jgi:aminopeptidase N
MARLDPHSYCDDTQAQTVSFALTAQVDFASRTLAGDVVLSFREPATDALDLDTRDLAIERVEDATGKSLSFELHPADPVVGSRLAIQLPSATPSIRVVYKTSPDASALQWLAPMQTAGGAQPFLFSQCQAIHARSVVPLQDTPRLRQRYTATVTHPRELTLVMAAADRGRSEDGALATHRFEMPQPIPPYLFAFAIGDLAARELSPRCRVWAEPSLVDAAAWEFADVPAMMTAAEALFGPYDWDRFDILTMPPSFPYGGMENPRLTFLTPTLIAGDRSLVSVVGHELAHSWTGNLVTNANAEHFWLNEGFTTYAERRIVEALYGTDMAALEAALGRRDLEESLDRFKEQPALTRLRTHLTGIDPDLAYSQVPYEKGYLFLVQIEAAVGRAAFVRWLRSYLDAFRFGSTTTEDFVAHIEANLPDALAKVDARTWLDGEGLPPTAHALRSTRLDAIEKLSGEVPTREQAAKWTPVEWALFLETVPRPAPHDKLRTLDAQYRLTEGKNYDVLVPWLTLALKSSYSEVLRRVDEVLGAVGRMKYLRPLYTALIADAKQRAAARAIFAKHGASYHPIARQMVDGLLRHADPG